MLQLVVLPYCKRQLKPLLKKYRDLKDSVIAALDTFDPEQHTHLGHGVYKIRVTTQGLRRGKSGAFRIILLLVEYDRLLVPITVYFKGDRQTLTKQELNDHLQHILFELDQQNSNYLS